MSAFTGTFMLTRLALRRDWFRLTLWVVGLAGLMTLMAMVVRDLVGTDEGTRAFVQLYVVNPVMRMFGLASGATIGAFTLTRVYIMFAVLVVLMSIFTVVRNTRANEDLGRTELIGSLAVGRHAGLAAALLVAVFANLLLAVLIALGLLLNGLDLAGSLAAGASVGALGIAFAGVAAMTAQLAGHSRRANGLAAIVMGVAALSSSIGNMIGRIDDVALRVEPAWPAWVSPFGWGQLIRPFDTNAWGFLAAFGAFFVVTTLLAFYMEARRDVGQGLLPQRRGPPIAKKGLLSATGLAWHQQRGVLIGWAVALVAIAAVYGLVSSEMEAIMEDMEEAREIFEAIGGTEVILEGYFSATIGIIALLASIYVIQGMLRARHEEIHGPLEGVLSTATGRGRWMNAHVVVTALGALGILLASGITMGLTAGLVLHDVTGRTLDLAMAAVVKLPAVLVFLGVTALAFGAFPRRSALIAWGAFLVALITGPMFGPLLDLPERVMDLSPFTHVAGPPADTVEPLALGVLLVVAVLLWSLAMVLFRRRDLDVH